MTAAADDAEDAQDRRVRRLRQLREVVLDLMQVRMGMMRAGLRIALLEPDNEEIVALLEAEGAAVAGLMGHIERLTDELAGPVPPERRGS